MITQFSKFVLVATIGLALAFTFSCSGNGGDDPSPSSASVGEQYYKFCITVIGCKKGSYTISTCDGEVSNTCDPNGNVSSSSLGGSSSSRSNSGPCVINGQISYDCDGLFSSSSGNPSVSSSSVVVSSSSIASSSSTVPIPPSSSSIPPSSSSAGTVAGTGADDMGTFTDTRDNTTYKWVKLGTQTWMAENLNYNVNGSKCYSNNDRYCTDFGRLYNWATAMDGKPSSAALPSGTKGICPDGWHLPSDAEWAILINYAGTVTQLKANSTLWSSNAGTDYYGFSALPGGYGGTDGSSFYSASSNGYWWSSSEYSSTQTWRYNIYGTTVNRDYYNKGYFFSVRCVQDGYIPPSIPSHATNGSTFVDSRDGTTYKSITIGTQTWMAENLNYAAPGSECYTNNEANCGTYGRLYTWTTALTVCPDDWHLPSDGEWATLISSVGGYSTAATQLRANSILWSSNTGTDYNGFSALPGGYGGTDGSSFGGASSNGYWWSSLEYNSNQAWRYNIYGTTVNRDYYNKGYFFSVRCIQDPDF